MSNQAPVPDIAARVAWTALQADPRARLCDVRTVPEWDQVGVPDLGTLGRAVDFISWQVAPSMQLNAGFIAALQAVATDPDHPIYFLCRSGARSRAAAEAAQAAGFQHVFNVAEGFEGRPGAYPGWQAQGLPALPRRPR